MSHSTDSRPLLANLAAKHSHALIATLLMLFFIQIPNLALHAKETAATRAIAGPASGATAGSPSSATVPIVIAHRGASGYLPEHSLASVAYAHALGADLIEQDIVLSKDHEPIVIHDRILDHVTNVADVFPKRKRNDGHYHVADFTLAELRQLTAHERTDGRTQKLAYADRFPVGGVPFEIATLAEHIELIQGLNRSTGRNVGLLVELKDPSWHREQGGDMSRIVLDTLAKYGYTTREDNAIIQTFDAAEVERLRKELHTDLRLVQLMNDQTLKLPADATEEQLSTALENLARYADGAAPSLEMVLSKNRLPEESKLTNFIDLAHDAGLTVYCYTFRTETVPPQYASFAELVETFADAGADGLITDFPDQVRAHLPANIK
jgi:glycerophosphoryl diester phosphodiesterase